LKYPSQNQPSHQIEKELLQKCECSGWTTQWLNYST